MVEQVPLWLVIEVLFAAMVIAYEAGMRLHRQLRSHADGNARDSSDGSYAVSYVFGLLAPLTGMAAR